MTIATASRTDIALAQLSINTIRFLAVDAVQKANSGHPGMPMGAAPMAYALWTKFLRHNPANPGWFDRDRFVLSAGHGSMLLYSLLHLTGYDLPMEELKRFRQLHSRTPGHPENILTPGVETTTGPLGQGFANGIGMAIAEKHLAALFNRPGFQIVNHHTYGIVSDGDLMEGVSHEAASLAGHLGLGKLTYLYDDNEISIDGSTDLSFTEDVGRRFEAYGWHVQHVDDGNDLDEISAAIQRARDEESRPSLIVVRTVIGFGSPNLQNTAEVHGSPLGEDEVILTKRNLGWEEEDTFFVPPQVREHMGEARVRGRELEEEWKQLLASYSEQHPQEAAQLQQWIAGELPPGWDEGLPEFEDGPSMATRASSGKVLDALGQRLGQLIGGSADLTGSNKTSVSGREGFQSDNPAGAYFYFGVREHGMASICNGIALHGGLRPYCGTFLVFSDYMRPAVRLAALMGTPVIYVFTHDSIGLGEDGPTHQPVEHLMALRAIPGLTVVRPADARETREAWIAAVTNVDGPVALVLTRQGVPTLETEADVREGVTRGAYVVRSSGRTPDVTLIGTGSELQLALEAAAALEEEGIATSVVSMPSWELFDNQDAQYRDRVLIPNVPRVSVEAGITQGWQKYVGDHGASIGIDRFGASAPWQELYAEFGITASYVVRRVKQVLDSKS